MKFSIWLESQNMSSMYSKVAKVSVYSNIIKMMGNYVGNERLRRWTDKVYELANEEVDFKIANELEDFIKIDASQTYIIHTHKELKNFYNNLISLSRSKFPLISAFFRDVMEVMILEKQDRISRIYQTLEDFADMLDMPPLTKVKSIFEKFKQMTGRIEFWQVTRYMVDFIEDLTELQPGSDTPEDIKNHIIYLVSRVLPPIFNPGGELNISFFLDDVDRAMENLEKF